MDGLVVIVVFPPRSESDLWLYKQEYGISKAGALCCILTSKNILGDKDNFKYFLYQILLIFSILVVQLSFSQGFLLSFYVVMMTDDYINIQECCCFDSDCRKHDKIKRSYVSGSCCVMLSCFAIE